MIELPDELQFLKLLPSDLSHVQNGFDRYQKCCFPARNSHFFALELCGEAGELANLEKKDWKGREIPPERFADEAADVLIALMNYCNARGVNLGRAVAEKVLEIERRRREEAT